jgi:hypothetical protein
MYRLPKLKFNPNAPGRYWYLSWIEKATIYKGNISRIKIHFINTLECKDYMRELDKSHSAVLELDVRVLMFLTIGSIYDVVDQCIVRHVDYATTIKDMKVSVVGDYRPTDMAMNLEDYRYTPFSNRIDFSNLSYYSFSGVSTEGNYRFDNIKVILPVTTLCQYLFFHSTNIVFSLLNYRLDQLFLLDEKKILIIDDCNVGYVRYNNKILSKSDAKVLAPFLFIKNDKGIISLNGISNNLSSYFYNNRYNKQKFNKGSYITTSWPFPVNSSFNISGKDFWTYTRHGEELDRKDVYFLAYEILNHSLHESVLNVDQIRVEGVYEKSNKKSDTTKREGVRIRQGKYPEIDGNMVDVNNAPNNNALPVQFNVNQKTSLFSFEIPIDILIRDESDPDFNVNLLLTEKELSSATLDNFNSDSLADHYPVEGRVVPNKSISRFDFIKMTVLELGRRGIDCSFNCLDKSIGFEMKYHFSDYDVMVVELNFKSYYFYLIEFEFGSTGFIHGINYEQIPGRAIELFIDFCLESLTSRKKNESFWSLVKRMRSRSQRLYDIIIETPLDHQMEGFNLIEDAIMHSADKIMNARILRLVS